MKLYEVLDPKGDKWNLVEARPLTREMMKSDSAFVLIAGGVVYSWIGQKCDNDRKKNAMQSALAFAKRNQARTLAGPSLDHEARSFLDSAPDGPPAILCC